MNSLYILDLFIILLIIVAAEQQSKIYKLSSSWRVDSKVGNYKPNKTINIL